MSKDVSNQDYIRKGVELADGWRVGAAPNFTISTPDDCYYYVIDGQYVPECLDALAAQLVRQVDALERIYIDVTQGCVDIKAFDEWTELEWMKSVSGPDRTINTTKVIVDSKLLERKT